MSQKSITFAYLFKSNIIMIRFITQNNNYCLTTKIMPIMKNVFLLTFNVTTKSGKFLFNMAHAATDEKVCQRLLTLCKDMYAEQGRKVTNVLIQKRRIWDE